MEQPEYALTAEQFEEAVGDGLDRLPDHLAEQLDNVVVLVEEEPTPDQLSCLGETCTQAQGETLYGLYEGVALPHRGEFFLPHGPDRIFVFRGPLSRAYRDADELREQVAITVLHELGHHFGMDDDRLHELGWG